MLATCDASLPIVAFRQGCLGVRSGLLRGSLTAHVLVATLVFMQLLVLPWQDHDLSDGDGGGGGGGSGAKCSALVQLRVQDSWRRSTPSRSASR